MTDGNKYTIQDFQRVLKNMTYMKLDENILTILSKIESEITIYDKEKFTYYKNKKSNNDTFQWQSIKNFQKTTILKNAGDYDITNILNKITDKNYEIQKKQLFDIIININANDNYEKDIDIIYNIIIDIVKNNIFLSLIYAKLSKEIFEINNNFYKKIIEDGKILSDYLLSKTEISNDESILHKKDKDYDILCKHNKNNDQKKSILLFFVNIFKNDEDNLYILMNILDKIFETFETNIYKEEEKQNNEEICELMFIILSNVKEIYEKYENKLFLISKYKIKNAPGMSNKILFKLMDILDNNT
jgi:hypothetical protein